MGREACHTFPQIFLCEAPSRREAPLPVPKARFTRKNELLFKRTKARFSCHVNPMDQFPSWWHKTVTQRSDCGFERRKTFAVEMNALARSSDIQRSFLSVSCEHYGSIPTLAAQTCDPAEAVTGLKRGAAEQVRTSYPCITTQQRGRDAEAKKRPVRLRDLAARRGSCQKGRF